MGVFVEVVVVPCWIHFDFSSYGIYSQEFAKKVFFLKFFEPHGKLKRKIREEKREIFRTHFAKLQTTDDGHLRRGITKFKVTRSIN